MEVDIYIKLDNGGEVNRVGLTSFEAIAEICDQYVLEEVAKRLNPESVRIQSMWDMLDDAIDDLLNEEIRNKLNKLKENNDEI